MLEKVVSIEHPYKIINGVAQGTDKPKHKTFDDIPWKERQYKRLFLVFRRLPNWMFSVIWQHMVHTKLNEKNRLKKTGVGRTYQPEFKFKFPILPPPELMCHSTYPDDILCKHYGPVITYLRMEYLLFDIFKHLNLVLKQIGYHHSYTENSPITTAEYWNKEAILTLRKNNPIWTRVETELYGK